MEKEKRTGPNLQLRIDPELRAWLYGYAHRTDRNVTAVVERLIRWGKREIDAGRGDNGDRK